MSAKEDFSDLFNSCGIRGIILSFPILKPNQDSSLFLFIYISIFSNVSLLCSNPVDQQWPKVCNITIIYNFRIFCMNYKRKLASDIFWLNLLPFAENPDFFYGCDCTKNVIKYLFKNLFENFNFFAVCRKKSVKPCLPYTMKSNEFIFVHMITFLILLTCSRNRPKNHAM